MTVIGVRTRPHRVPAGKDDDLIAHALKTQVDAGVRHRQVPNSAHAALLAVSGHGFERCKGITLHLHHGQRSVWIAAILVKIKSWLSFQVRWRASCNMTR